jgi:hypothetical protein
MHTVFETMLRGEKVKRKALGEALRDAANNEEPIPAEVLERLIAWLKDGGRKPTV